MYLVPKSFQAAQGVLFIFKYLPSSKGHQRPKDEDIVPPLRNSKWEEEEEVQKKIKVYLLLGKHQGE